MKIRPVGAELFLTDRRTWRSQSSLFAILLMRPIKTIDFWMNWNYI